MQIEETGLAGAKPIIPGALCGKSGGRPSGAVEEGRRKTVERHLDNQARERPQPARQGVGLRLGKG